MNLKLKNLSNDNLISDLKDIVCRERELLTKLLHYLKEVEQRRLYAQKGYDSLFSFIKALDLALERLDPENKPSNSRRKPSQPKMKPTLTPAPECKAKRYIPQKIKRQIWRRDKGKCQFKDKRTGQLCHSQYKLELDHAWPYSLGGSNTVQNLRLHCRTHNQYRASLIFKSSHLLQ